MHQGSTKRQIPVAVAVVKVRIFRPLLQQFGVFSKNLFLANPTTFLDD